MRIHIATDHAGMELSAFLVTELTKLGHELVDHGPKVYDALDDYPGFCIAAAQAVVADQSAGVSALGIVLGGSGNGEQIAANKVKGIRASLCFTENQARTTRQHNDSNMICLSGDAVDPPVALALTRIWLESVFRHERKVLDA